MRGGLSVVGLGFSVTAGFVVGLITVGGNYFVEIRPSALHIMFRTPILTFRSSSRRELRLISEAVLHKLAAWAVALIILRCQKEFKRRADNKSITNGPNRRISSN